MSQSDADPPLAYAVFTDLSLETVAKPGEYHYDVEFTLDMSEPDHHESLRSEIRQRASDANWHNSHERQDGSLTIEEFVIRDLLDEEEAQETAVQEAARHLGDVVQALRKKAWMPEQAHLLQQLGSIFYELEEIVPGVGDFYDE